MVHRRGARKQVIFVAARPARGEKISQKNLTFSKSNSAYSLIYAGPSQHKGDGQSCPGACMRFLSFAYRFLANFLFLGVAYFSLNFIENYQNRAMLAILVLVYSGMRAASALRSFFFFQRIERLEAEARRLLALVESAGGGALTARKQIVSDVSLMRRDSEMKSYMDLFFLA